MMRFLLLLLLLGGCTPFGAQPTSSTTITSPSQASAIPKTPEKTKEKEEEEEEVEDHYWKSVSYGYAEFLKTIKLVDEHYIKPKYDRNLAFVYAANFALHALDDTKELATVAFYEKQKIKLSERYLWAGAVEKIDAADAYYIHTIDKKAQEEERTKLEGRTLSDREILDRINQEKQLQRERDESWTSISFGQKGFEKIMTYIAKHQEQKPDKTKRAYLLATQGYLRYLDPHSAIISAEEWKESTEKIQDASFEGIGALLRKEGKYVLIETPLNEHQPAYKAGLLPGDLIIKVNNTVVESMALTKVVTMIKGPKGSHVTLTIRRKGTPKDFDVSLVRDYVAIKNVESRMLTELPNMGYMKVTGFVDTTLRDMLTHFQQLLKSTKNQIEGLVIDFRNNAGGKLDQAIQIADIFLARNSHVVSIQYAPNKKPKEEVFSAQLPMLIPLPLVVLINARSASASEIVASAIQDNERGFVVGVRSYGKGTVQNLIPDSRLSPRYYVKLTIALFLRKYTQANRVFTDSVQVRGVIPDFSVPENPAKDFEYFYREESSPGHLDPIPFETITRNNAAIQKTQTCISQTGTTEKTLKSITNPKLKPDRQLLMGVDVMRCMIKEKVYTPLSVSARRR